MTELTFAAEITRLPINLPRAALQLARELAYPSLDVEAALHQIADLAQLAGDTFAADAPLAEQATAVAHFLFGRMGFQGNRTHYNDPENSYLNRVLERRLGIPISLSVLYLAVAQQLAIPAYGVGLPGHFIVGVATSNDVPIYLDPFHAGRVLTRGDCVQLVADTAGVRDAFQEKWLKPTPPLRILMRMLNNLRVMAIENEAWGLATAVIKRIQLMDDKNPSHWRDLGLLQYRQQNYYHAVRLLETYLKEAPDAPDASNLRSAMRHNLDSWVAQN